MISHHVQSDLGAQERHTDAEPSAAREAVNDFRTSMEWPKHLEKDDFGAIEYQYEDRDGVTQRDFSEEKALAAMLLAEAVFLNSNWWMKEWPEAAKKTVALCVNTNDVFAWGCADAEDITYDQIEEVYRYWAKDPSWGTAVWAMIKNREMPQRPVEKRIRDGGIWDLDALRKEHGLRPNHYDGVNGVMAQLKYAAYCAWERLRGKEPRPFDAQWWAGWRAYTETHPDWRNDAWKAREAAALEDFRTANGWSDTASAAGEAKAATPASQSPGNTSSCQSTGEIP